MDQSFVCGRNVRTPLFGVILGIFVLIHSGFSNVVSQDEVYREAVTEGYLIDGFFLSPRSTALPKRPETAEAPQKPSSQSKDSDVFDERLDALHHVSTTESVELHQSSKQLSTEFRYNDEGSGDFMYTRTQSGSRTQNSNLKTTENSPFEGSGDSMDPVLATVESSPSKGTKETTDQVLTSTESSPFEGSGEPTDQVLTTTENSPFEGSGELTDLVFTTTENSPSKGTKETTDQVLTSTESSPFEGSGEPTDQVLTSTKNNEFEGSGATTDLVFTTMKSSTAVVMQRDIDSLATSSPSFMSTSVSPVSTTQTGSVSSNSERSRFLPPPVIRSPSAIELGQSAETKGPQPGKVNESSDPKIDKTPGWIIIVAFIVGVAALVMLCVAIATKDKWNGPNQASQLKNKTNSSNQPKELEMETFLQKDRPMENGEAEEYTVIQLDDLAEKYSSD